MFAETGGSIVTGSRIIISNQTVPAKRCFRKQALVFIVIFSCHPRRTVEMTAYGKPGKLKSSFPPFPHALEIPAGFPHYHGPGDCLSGKETGSAIPLAFPFHINGDLSRRVGDSLHSMVPTVENYSIDESFLDLGEFNSREVEPLARELRNRVKQWVGIPTCVGIGPTKTLAKVANYVAKKRPRYVGVCDLRSESVRRELLPTVPVEEVWGIGGASAAKLAKLGILTAADLAALEPDDARALMTVTGGRTVYELRGISCMPLELVEPTRKGIAVTRSFGNPVTTWLEMREALASYATRAAEKMRRYKVAADNLFVFMHTNTFNNDPFYSNGASARFPVHDERHRRSGRSRGAPGRTALPRRLPLRQMRRADYGAAARGGPAAGLMERARPRA